MSIWNDNTNFYVKFNCTSGWLLEETHVQLDTDLVGHWIHSNGIPIPGQFDYSARHNPMVATYQYDIPRSGYPYAVGDTIIIVAHASLKKYNPSTSSYQQETAFGGDNPGPGPRWWFYMKYVITEPIDPDTTYTYHYETAMVRMYDNPSDFTFRWMMSPTRPHAWFSFIRTTPVMTPQKYYFYAGQHFKAGEVDVWKANDTLFVACSMMNGWQATSSHLNVQLTNFMGPPAFGNFPWKATHNPSTNMFTYSVPWNSAWNAQQLRIALHADVRKPIVTP